MTTAQYGAWQRAAQIAVAGLPFLVLLSALWPEAALAQEGANRVQESDVPWVEILKTIRDSMCGPVAQYAVVIALVVTGLMVAFGELQGLFASFLRFVMGASLALMAAQFADLFGLGRASCGA